MSIKEDGNMEAGMKEKLVAMLKQIIADEKFKLDAFYLCGAASGLPNEGLRKACEKYIEMDESGQRDESVVSGLIAELEKAVTTKAKITVVGDLVNNKAEIEEVFANKEFL